MAYGEFQDLRPHVSYLAKQRDALRERAQRFHEKRKEHLKAAVATVEVMGGAAIAGVIQGRAGEKGAHIGPFPASLVIGGGLIAAGIFASTGKGGTFTAASDHLVDFGTGFLAEFAGNWGYGVGQRWKEDGHLNLFGKSDHHALPPGGAHTGRDLTPHEMANLVRQVQAGG